MVLTKDDPNLRTEATLRPVYNLLKDQISGGNVEYLLSKLILK